MTRLDDLSRTECAGSNGQEKKGSDAVTAVVGGCRAVCGAAERDAERPNRTSGGLVGAVGRTRRRGRGKGKYGGTQELRMDGICTRCHCL